jgi:hypothetical protein
MLVHAGFMGGRRRRGFALPRCRLLIDGLLPPCCRSFNGALPSAAVSCRLGRRLLAHDRGTAC